MYSHGGFEGSSGCTLQFPSTELFLSTQLSKVGLPLPVSLFLRNRGGLVNDSKRHDKFPTIPTHVSSNHSTGASPSIPQAFISCTYLLQSQNWIPIHIIPMSHPTTVLDFPHSTQCIRLRGQEDNFVSLTNTLCILPFWKPKDLRR